MAAVRKEVGEEDFGIFVRNKYTLCPISRLNNKVKAVWYARHGVIGYDRSASPKDIASAVTPAMKDYGKKKQGPEGNQSFDAKGTLLSGQVVPMFRPACLKVFRECF